ncbi:izumo sperm-egg fusion protein 1 isoform X2 [Pseudophryne corroboree]|uniref:izumo sperm-egg fusion protein 1 isoform X2 n=1 Tax=Pseudophryne corroboree TaxID=495146 RepID=UPI0030813526
MMQTFTTCESCEEEKLVCVGGPAKLSDWFDKCSCYCTSEKACQDLQTGQSCTPCKNYIHFFNAALFCGERIMEVEEDEDLILDCRLMWHLKLEDQYQFAFYKNSDQFPMKMSDDPFFVKKEMQMNDSDVYLCRTQLLSGIPVSIITYKVNVVNRRTTRAFKPRPTLPDIAPDIPHTAANVDIEETISTHAQIVTYVCGSFIIIVILSLSVYLLCKKETITKKDFKKEKKYLEDMEAMDEPVQ